MKKVSAPSRPISYLRIARKRFRGYFFKKNCRALIQKHRHKAAPSENLDEIFKDRREDFDQNIDKMRHIGLRILKVLDYMATKYDFSYFLSYGSLLGAIRHQGFIPWDDDVDIMMTRKDFERFMDVCHQLPDSLDFFPMGNNFLKVMDRYSIVSLDGQRGVAVDIFLLDEKSDIYRFQTGSDQKIIDMTSADVFPLRRTKFESQDFLIPANPDKILSAIYGNYMEFPPEEQRVLPHVTEDSLNIYKFGESRKN